MNEISIRTDISYTAIQDPSRFLPSLPEFPHLQSELDLVPSQQRERDRLLFGTAISDILGERLYPAGSPSLCRA